MRPAQWKLLIFVPILMLVGAGVTYWIQWSKLRAKWAEWVPERPPELTETNEELADWEEQIRTGDWSVLPTLAGWYRAQGQPTAALAAFETLRELDGDNGAWWLATAGLNAQQGERRLAGSQLQRARELGLPDGRSHAEAGRLSEVLGDQVEAKEDYRNAVAQNPALVPVWMRLIALYRAIGDNRAAREAFETALRENPGAPALLLDRARRFRERRNWRQALLDFERVRESHPELPEPWYASAQALFELDRYEEGRELLAARLAIDPQDRTALMLLCVEAIAKQDRAESDRLIQQMRDVVSISPREWARLEAAYRQTFNEAPPET